MSSPVSRIALSAALSVASLAVPAVHADDASPEAPPPKEDAGIHQPEPPTTGDVLLIEYVITELSMDRDPGGCFRQCCHTVQP